MIKSRMMRNCQVRFCEGEGMATYASLLDIKDKVRASVEYKTSGYKLSQCRRYLKFTDGFKAGSFKL